MKPQEKLDKAFSTISAKIIKNLTRVKQMLRDWQREREEA